MPAVYPPMLLYHQCKCQPRDGGKACLSIIMQIVVSCGPQERFSRVPRCLWWKNSLITAALDICYLWLLMLKDKGRLLHAAAKKKRATTERCQRNDFIPILWRRKGGSTTNKNGVSTTNREIASWDDFFSLKVQGEINKSRKSEPICQSNSAMHIIARNDELKNK